MRIGDRLRQALKEAGMKQRELARAVGVTDQAVYRWVHDIKTPSAYSIKMICKALDISADWLLGIKE